MKALLAIVNDGIRADLHKYVLVITTDLGQQGRSDLQALTIQVLSTDDKSPSLFAAASVTATPSALHIANPGFIAEHHEIGVDAEWLTALLQSCKESAAPHVRV